MSESEGASSRRLDIDDFIPPPRHIVVQDAKSEHASDDPASPAWPLTVPVAPLHARCCIQLRASTRKHLTTSSTSRTSSPSTLGWRGSRCAQIIRRFSLRVAWRIFSRFAPCVALRCTTPSRVSAVQSKGILCSTGRAGAVRTLHETLPIGARAASCATAGDRFQAPATAAPVGCTPRSSGAT